MSKPDKLSLAQIFYRMGFIVLFCLAFVSMVAFIRAVSYRVEVPQASQKPYADSIQVEQLRFEVDKLNAKVDSLIFLNMQEPKVKFKYLKPRKDSCVIELNVNDHRGNNIADNK